MIVEDVLNFIEKRIFKRLPTEVPVELEVGGKKLNGQTRNISCGGMFLRIDPKHLKNGGELNVVIHLPNQKNPVKVVGEVLRHESDGVAVEFQGLYNDNILAIERFVKSNLN